MIQLKKLFPLCLLAVCMLAVPAARAQNGLYAEYTGSVLTGVANTPKFHGPTVGAYLESKHARIFSGGIDFQGSFLSGSDNMSLDTGMAGLRLVVQPPALPIAPYGEVLIGTSSSTVGKHTETAFLSSIVLGLDYKIIPRLDWRAIEFSYGSVATVNSFSPASFSTGLVLRFP